MLIKVVLSNSVGPIDHQYMSVIPDLGGYVNTLQLPKGWCLDHGDTIKVVFLDRSKEDGDTTAEDDRQMAAAKA
jgi:hypothetical protein